MKNERRGLLNDVQKVELSELLFADTTRTIEDLEVAYPARAGTAPVTRFCPSPTGNMHIGGLFSALVSERYAHMNGGVFYLRIEDTDKNREVEQGVEGIISALQMFEVKYDEGIVDTTAKSANGSYGPYIQSERLNLYRICAKELVRTGLAYPCFATPEELSELRATQEATKIRPGYYGKWAKGSDLLLETIKGFLAEKKPYVIRLRAQGSDSNHSQYNDLIKGDISVTENDQDIVLLKSDGYPTYHLAHAVDDHFMRTTHVLRGDEWLSSLPIHLELFAAFGWTAPRFGHFAPLLKQEGGGRRKLSKRKDPEAAVSYYADNGYPIASVIEYLLNIANSDFEPWRVANPNVANEKFPLKLERMSKSGGLFDVKKLDDISKNIIGRMSAEEVYKGGLAWAAAHDVPLAELLRAERDYAMKVLGVERGGPTTRKDIAKWSDLREAVGYFFDSIYTELSTIPAAATATTGSTISRAVLDKYMKVYDFKDPKEVWFNKLKDFVVSEGYARDTKEFKANPANFKGSVGDVAMMLRAALTTKTRTPDLHEMMQVMGEERVRARLAATVERLNHA